MEEWDDLTHVSKGHWDGEVDEQGGRCEQEPRGKLLLRCVEIVTLVLSGGDSGKMV